MDDFQLRVHVSSQIMAALVGSQLSLVIQQIPGSKQLGVLSHPNQDILATLALDGADALIRKLRNPEKEA